jgi:hypothetical protein
MEGGGSLMHSQETGSSSRIESLVERRRSVAEYTIWGKVVASPESGPWCVLWSKVPVACPNTQGCLGNVN